MYALRQIVPLTFAAMRAVHLMKMVVFGNRASIGSNQMVNPILICVRPDLCAASPRVWAVVRLQSLMAALLMIKAYALAVLPPIAAARGV